MSAYAGILEKIDGQVMRKFTLVDIDGNSVPELVCMNGYSHADVSVAYECIDGTASEIEGAGSDSGIFICAPGTGKIAKSYFINSVGSFPFSRPERTIRILNREMIRALFVFYNSLRKCCRLYD